MPYYSLNNPSQRVSFKEAVIQGLAPDKGLYFPDSIHTLPTDFFAKIEEYSDGEIAFEAIAPFVGDSVSTEALKEIIAQTLNFDFPVEAIEDQIGTLELFHGPTMAFKDVGARFMANCLGYFNQNSSEKVTVLVATSGDTGGAVASGFLGVEGVEVVILYPSGKVSEIQEKQLTALGQNITALEVDGVFDDCQDMVKKAFLDPEINRTLTSANSINVARWLPQMFYYFFAYKQLKRNGKELVFSVPSGNFGNICAGMMAQKLGLPVGHFIAATNQNDTVVRYLKDGHYAPKPSISTISNAMDVGNPSNFVRILQLFDNDDGQLKNHFSSYAFTDDETRAAMKSINKGSGYIADPHGAVGYLGLKKHGLQEHQYGVFLETAHPVKFLDIVTSTLETEVSIPPQIAAILPKEKKATSIKSYSELVAFLNA